MNIRRSLISTVLLVCCIAFPFKAQAYTERNPLQKIADEAKVRKTIVLNQGWVPYPMYNNRSAWDQLMGANKEKLIKKGEKLLTYKWQVVPATAYLEYERTGERKIMENPYDDNREAINALMLAELAEGKGRFIDQLINGVYLSCEMNSWVLSAHLPRQTSQRALPDFRQQIIDLGSGGYGSLMAWVYYFFHSSFDQVDPVISLQMRKVIKERILDPYMNDDTMWWMAFNWKSGELINNWNPWCNTNVLQCFLLMENDPERLAKAVYRSMTSVDRFLNFVKSDGACEEGPSYWGHAAGKLYDYLEILSQGTGGQISLLNDPMVRRMGEYISRSYVGNGWVVNFADASAKGGGDPMLIYRFGKSVGSSEMMGFAAYLLDGMKPSVSSGNDAFRSLESIRFCDELAQTAPKHHSPSVTWYPETEFCYMQNKNGLFVAAKGGFNNESHNHNDVGTFSLYANTIPVIIDAGVGTYTRQTFSEERYSIWTMQSNYHNLPMINGIPQSFGQDYKAQHTTCNVSKQQFSTDISGAYPANANVKSWLRSYRLKGNELLISDDFTLLQSSGTHQINFLTWGEVSVERPGKIKITVQGQTVELTYPKELKAEIETVKLDDPRLSSVWGKEIYRIGLKANQQMGDSSKAGSQKDKLQKADSQKAGQQMLKADHKVLKGSYQYSIKQVKP